MDEKFVDEVRKAMDRINSNGGVIASDYSRHIFDAIAEDVAEDVAVTADTGYNDDDIRLSVGRVLMKRLGIEI